MFHWIFGSVHYIPLFYVNLSYLKSTWKYYVQQNKPMLIEKKWINKNNHPLLPKMIRKKIYDGFNWPESYQPPNIVCAIRIQSKNKIFLLNAPSDTQKSYKRSVFVEKHISINSKIPITETIWIIFFWFIKSIGLILYYTK
jgi:hypothetical protein